MSSHPLSSYELDVSVEIYGHTIKVWFYSEPFRDAYLYTGDPSLWSASRHYQPYDWADFDTSIVDGQVVYTVGDEFISKLVMNVVFPWLSKFDTSGYEAFLNRSTDPFERNKWVISLVPDTE